MNELKKLKDAFEALQEGVDAPIEAILEGITDEGQLKEFLTFLNDKSKQSQAEFLSYLVRFRKGCVDRLLELTKSDDESTVIYAASGLVHDESCRNVGINILHEKSLERISNESMNEDDWPLHFLLDFLIEEGCEECIDATKDILNKANRELDKNSEGFRGIADLISSFT